MKTLPAVSVWDLDNCLANDAWRITMIKWQEPDIKMRFDEYHRACVADRPGNEALFQTVTINTIPVFATARPEYMRRHTMDWLTARFGIGPAALYMRETDNHEPSLTLKEKMIDNILQAYNVLCAFDDREDIVRMYRAKGINAARVWIHEQTVWPKGSVT